MIKHAFKIKKEEKQIKNGKQHFFEDYKNIL